MRFYAVRPRLHSPDSSPFFLHVLIRNSRSLLGVLALSLMIVFSAVAQGSNSSSQSANPPQFSSVPDTDRTGILEMVWEDLPGSHRLRYFLNTATGRLELHFVSGEPVGVTTGMNVVARGKVIPPDMYLMTPTAIKGTGARAGAPAALTALSSPITFGNQTTLVLLVNFQDDASQPFDPAAIQDVVFNSTDAFYREVSQNQTWLTGKVVQNWITVPMTSQVCDFIDLANLADQAATTAGETISAYRHIIYAFQTKACDFIGASYLNGNRIWVNGNVRVEVIGHEMGHNLGLYHSHALDCGALPTGPNCTKIEYGDIFDIMGDVLAAHFNAYQKERLGYLNYGTSLPITTVTASGTYDISPYEYFLPNTPPSKALKIVTDLDPTMGFNNLFYVEYRQLLGFDSSMQGYPTAVQGVLVHQASSTRIDTSYLLDMHPGSGSFVDAALEVGESFTDPASGLSIALLSADQNGASVKVTYSADACGYNPPNVTIAPTTYSVAPGTTVNYTATIKNNDGPTCSDSSFTLSNSTPAGFTVSLDKTFLALAHGTSGQVTMTVSSSATTSGGNYRIYLAAKDDASGYSGASAGSYIVLAPFALSVVPAAVSAAQGGAATTTVTTTVNSPFSNPIALNVSGTPSGVTASFAPASFPAPGSGKSTLTLSVGPNVVPGIYSLLVTGTGGALTQQAPLTLTVNSSGDFNLSANPSSVNVTTGGSASTTITSTVLGSFSSSVGLSISGLPSSITADFSPALIASPGGSSTLTFHAKASAIAGSTYLFTITGVGGTFSHSVMVSVTVVSTMPPPPGPISPIPQSGYKLVLADSQESQCGIHPATAAFDGNPSTFWQTQSCLGTRPLPHEIQIDLGATYVVAGFRYVPRQDALSTGKVGNAQFYVSNNPQSWGNPVSSNALITVPSDITQKEVLFNHPVSGRYVRFVALSEVSGGQVTTMAELTVLQSNAIAPPPPGDFNLSSAPSVLSVVQGNSISTLITSTLSGAFSSSIALSATGLPSGLNIGFNPGSIAAPGSGNSALTFNTAGVAFGTYPITVTGTAGLVTHSITVMLTVTSPNPPPPGLTLIPQSGWKLKYVDSQESQCGFFLAQFAFDGNPNTIWQTQSCLGTPAQPHELQVDLGASYNIKGLRYLPRQDGVATGKIATFEFYVSADGISWGAPIATGTLVTNPTDSSEKQIVLNAPSTGRFVRLRSITEVNGGKTTSMAELNVLQ